MLAEDEITIRVGKELVFLRPTLRAATRLERAFGGFDTLLQALLDESVTAMATVIRESETGRSSIPDLIESLAGMPLHLGIESLKQPLIDHVLCLAGHEPDAEPESADASKAISFAEHHAKLYRIATGWLGWTPETAWDSTASEIIEAFKGRAELLQAIFGSGDGSAPISTEEPSAEVFNAKLSAALAMASARFAGLDGAA